MGPDKTDVNKILSMDDSKLKETLSDIAYALGADENKASALISDVPLLKAKISQMSDEELQKLIASVGKEKAEKIIRSINGK